MKNRVREKRGEFGYTQEQLGEMIGVSRQTIISIENGRYNPSLLLAYKIAQAFRCTIEEIFIFDGEE
jgi:putative transcriptional regulator